ncbi:MAG: endonuclease/exonuclease/phosphatase family protein [Acidimicrobiales bacterium]|nr:endonuclease/exonuclease/phosphatase family protein [Acidimicrobiales bacterium]
MGERGDTSGRARRALVGGAVAVVLATAAACTTPGGGSGGGGRGPLPRGEVSVLTYNVAGLPQEISTENPEEHIPLISPLLNEYDIVLTQEDFDWWQGVAGTLDFVHYHERLRAEATHEYRSEPHPGPEAVGLDPDSRPLQIGDGLGVLSRLPFTGNTRVPWTGCFGGFDTSDGGAADCLAMKGFAMVTLTLADGVEVDLYTLHAEAGGTDEDQRLQAQDFDELATFIEDHSAGRAVIIGGDTNLHTDDSHPDAERGADTEIWESFLERTDLADACTAATRCAEPGSIDKIAYRSGSGVKLAATSHDMPRERFTAPDGDDLSDHPPVVVELTWKARR